jgi:hypothetical protein
LAGSTIATEIAESGKAHDFKKLDSDCFSEQSAGTFAAVRSRHMDRWWVYGRWRW